jgi:hypothetical protein
VFRPGFLRRRANSRHAAPAPTHFLAGQSSTSSHQRTISHAGFFVPTHHIVLAAQRFLDGTLWRSRGGGPAQNVIIREISRSVLNTRNPHVSARVYHCRWTRDRSFTMVDGKIRTNMGVENPIPPSRETGCCGAILLADYRTHGQGGISIFAPSVGCSLLARSAAVTKIPLQILFC